MSKKLKNLFALICAAAICAGSLGLLASAEESMDEAVEKAEATIIPCTVVPLYRENEYIGSGILVDDVSYVPLLSFVELMLGEDETCEAEYDTERGCVSLTSPTLSLSMTLDESFMEVNGRYLYFPDGVYNVNGTILVPLRELARVFCLGVEWDSEELAVYLTPQEDAVFLPGEEFYDESDLYWLSHVIFSESGNQPLEGMIGVGNVVLNRAADESGSFADSIYGVIFQYGQFDVARTGAIHLTPNELSLVAAKLCLEGYNTVGDSKWFLNPKIGSAAWFNTYKTLTYSIADHDFYA